MSNIDVVGVTSPAIIQARQDLAKANGDVDADKRAHSPGCVTIDQKHAIRAQADLDQAITQAATSTAATATCPATTFSPFFA